MTTLEGLVADSARLRRWLGDASALLVVVGALVSTASFDGGFPTGTLRLAGVGMLGLLALGVVGSEAGRLSGPGRMLLAAWGLGLLVALAAALDRSSFEHPLLTYALVPIVALAGRRLWARSWGPPALTAVLAASLLWYWQDAFFAWWGWRMAGRPDARWAALSWHNQSGMLMGAYGLLFLGVALRTMRGVVVAALLSGMALAAAWLSGSRGAIGATAVGMVVILAVLRRHDWRRVGTRAGIVASLTILAVAGLLTLGPGSQGSPVTTRAEPVADALGLRLDHMRAGLGMFAARPLTGHGPGAYRRTAPGFASPEVHLTVAAHSEPVEALAEGGLAFGLPFLLTLGGAGILVLGAVGRGIPPGGAEGLREGLAAGMAGAAAGLGVHLMVDFDWLYPVLAFLLAVAVVGVEGVRGGGEAPAARRGWAAAAPVGLALLVAVAAVLVPGERPWHPVPRLREALTLSAQGAHGEALEEVEGALAWNPGNASLEVGAALVRYRAGLARPSEVRGTLRPSRTGPALYNLAARVLLDGGDRAVAGGVLEELVELYPHLHETRRPPSVVAETWVLRVRLEAETRGCDAARRLAEGAAADPVVDRGSFVEDLREYAEQVCAAAGQADCSRSALN